MSIENFILRLKPSHFQYSIKQGLELYLPIKDYKKGDLLYQLFYDELFLEQYSKDSYSTPLIDNEYLIEAIDPLSKKVTHKYSYHLNSETPNINLIFNESLLDILTSKALDKFKECIKQIDKQELSRIIESLNIPSEEKYIESLLFYYSGWIRTVIISFKTFNEFYKRIRNEHLEEDSIINRYIFKDQINFNEFAKHALHEMIDMITLKKNHSDFCIDYEMRSKIIYELAYKWSYSKVNFSKHKKDIRRLFRTELNRIKIVKENSNKRYLPIYDFVHNHLMEEIKKIDLILESKPFNISTFNVNVLLYHFKLFGYFKNAKDDDVRRFLQNEFHELNSLIWNKSQKTLADLLRCLENLEMLDKELFLSEVVKKGKIKALDKSSGKPKNFLYNSFKSELRKINKSQNSTQLELIEKALRK